MCKIMEEYAEERFEDYKDNLIEQNLEKGKTPEDIADYIGVSVERVMEVKERKTVLV